MDRDPERAQRYGELADLIRKISDQLSNGDVRRKLLSMVAEYENLARYFETSDVNANVSGASVGLDDERVAANREARATYIRLEALWRALSAELDKGSKL